ncbi:MAG: Mur ligase domain-containing protein [Bacteroidetes bacterium]|nr:Mur ligase domain-containing protein [Bacteroidota bacterium]
MSKFDRQYFMEKNGKRIHFIAIGGAAMHNLALALHQKGYNISGSDDEINEPSRSRLSGAGLLPSVMGWFPEKITGELDAIILGMHARADNPELLRAQQLGLKIFSYPEYLYEFSKHKLRVVIGGSHGKTTITAMILHVLKQRSIDFDYMVGAKLDGFDTMVRLSEKAPLIVLEGDEYLSSPIDRRPKFHLYHADIALLSGIAWDHINVFPTYAEYVRQFQIYVDQIPPAGTIVYCSNDQEVLKVIEDTSSYCKKVPYSIPAHRIKNGKTYLIHNDAEGHQKETGLEIFGDHNLMNLLGAKEVCSLLGISDDDFYNAVSSFKGAARRLEKLGSNETLTVFKDFAHSPSKLKATIEAVKNQYPDRQVIACMELHTFSSLTGNFLAEYNGSMEKADEAIVYFNPLTIAHKKLKPVSPEQVRDAFQRSDLVVFTESDKLRKHLLDKKHENAVLLMMSSGTYDGIDLEVFTGELLAKRTVTA